MACFSKHFSLIWRKWANVYPSQDNWLHTSLNSALGRVLQQSHVARCTPAACPFIAPPTSQVNQPNQRQTQRSQPLFPAAQDSHNHSPPVSFSICSAMWPNYLFPPPCLLLIWALAPCFTWSSALWFILPWKAWAFFPGSASLLFSAWLLFFLAAL